MSRVKSERAAKAQEMRDHYSQILGRKYNRDLPLGEAIEWWWRIPDIIDYEKRSTIRKAVWWFAFGCSVSFAVGAVLAYIIAAYRVGL